MGYFASVDQPDGMIQDLAVVGQGTKPLAR